MKRLVSKLHSERGMSMVIALVFFLICMIAGSVIVNAVAATTSKTLSREAEQRDYLAVSSAAELLRTRLGGTEYYQVSKERKADDLDPETGEVIGSHWESDGSSVVTNPESGNLLTRAYQNRGSSLTSETTISETGGAVGDVHAALTIDQDTLQITIVLTPQRENASPYSQTLHFSCGQKSGSGSISSDERYSYTLYRWDEGTIYKSGAAAQGGAGA